METHRQGETRRDETNRRTTIDRRKRSPRRPVDSRLLTARRDSRADPATLCVRHSTTGSSITASACSPPSCCSAPPRHACPPVLPADLSPAAHGRIKPLSGTLPAAQHACISSTAVRSVRGVVRAADPACCQQRARQPGAEPCTTTKRCRSPRWGDVGAWPVGRALSHPITTAHPQTRKRAFGGRCFCCRCWESYRAPGLLRLAVMHHGFDEPALNPRAQHCGARRPGLFRVY